MPDVPAAASTRETHGSRSNDLKYRMAERRRLLQEQRDAKLAAKLARREAILAVRQQRPVRKSVEASPRRTSSRLRRSTVPVTPTSEFSGEDDDSEQDNDLAASDSDFGAASEAGVEEEEEDEEAEEDEDDGDDDDDDDASEDNASEDESDEANSRRRVHGRLRRNGTSAAASPRRTPGAAERFRHDSRASPMHRRHGSSSGHSSAVNGSVATRPIPRSTGLLRELARLREAAGAAGSRRSHRLRNRASARRTSRRFARVSSSDGGGDGGAQDDELDDDTDSSDSSGGDDAGGSGAESDELLRGSYSLRRQTKVPQRFEPIIGRSSSRSKDTLLSRLKGAESKQQRPHTHRRRQHAAGGVSSSPSDSSDNDGNAVGSMGATGFASPSKMARGRDTRTGDVQPMDVDKSVTWESLGGVQNHISALKEMIVLPLLYPEVFARFDVEPPRGVLFYGPPGTGKTLMARALANSCSSAERPVSFFMRKGADVLSKWVGEAEKQLRMLFDEAKRRQPSVIFFDELDGLAPVRSSRQDQIHSSIVSTMLALMDGLDKRGQIVVIGATNRIDAIDPALRRPGRFDREFMFTLPSQAGRRSILGIHTARWSPLPDPAVLDAVAVRAVGYSGADLKALCTEAALRALRRQYPQIYDSEDKLVIQAESVCVATRDFFSAMDAITPTSQRSAIVAGEALPPSIAPLLQPWLTSCLRSLHHLMPSLVPVAHPISGDLVAFRRGTDDTDRWGEPVQVSAPSASDTVEHGVRAWCAVQRDLQLRPARLVLPGSLDDGVDLVARGVLHALEEFPVHTLDLGSIWSSLDARSPEQAIVHVLQQVRLTAPCVLYLPRLDTTWAALGDIDGRGAVQSALLALLEALPPAVPVMVLVTTSTALQQLSPSLSALFPCVGDASVSHCPSVPLTPEQVRVFFQPVLAAAVSPTIVMASQRVLPPLARAPPPPPSALSIEEQQRVDREDEVTLRELRIELRACCARLAQERRFKLFHEPVREDEVPGYYDIVFNPLDLGTMVDRIDDGWYRCIREFLDDIDVICNNTVLYYGQRHDASRRARALRDLAAASLDLVDRALVRRCDDVAARRGISSRGTPRPAPTPRALTSSDRDAETQNRSLRRPASNGRYSTRLSGKSPDKADPTDLDDVLAAVRKANLAKRKLDFDRADIRGSDAERGEEDQENQESRCVGDQECDNGVARGDGSDLGTMLGMPNDTSNASPLAKRRRTDAIATGAGDGAVVAVDDGIASGKRPRGSDTAVGDDVDDADVNVINAADADADVVGEPSVKRRRTGDVVEDPPSQRQSTTVTDIRVTEIDPSQTDGVTIDELSQSLHAKLAEVAQVRTVVQLDRLRNELMHCVWSLRQERSIPTRLQRLQQVVDDSVV